MLQVRTQDQTVAQHALCSTQEYCPSVDHGQREVQNAAARIWSLSIASGMAVSPTSHWDAKRKCLRGFWLMGRK